MQSICFLFAILFAISILTFLPICNLSLDQKQKEIFYSSNERLQIGTNVRIEIANGIANRKQIDCKPGILRDLHLEPRAERIVHNWPSIHQRVCLWLCAISRSRPSSVPTYVPAPIYWSTTRTHTYPCAEHVAVCFLTLQAFLCNQPMCPPDWCPSDTQAHLPMLSVVRIGRASSPSMPSSRLSRGGSWQL